MSLLACCNVQVVHGSGEAAVTSLDGVSLDVRSGESLALIGRSGSGKTTLLHVLAGLAEPDRGTVERSATTALVFQAANLLPHFTAYENVAFAAHDSAVPELLLGLVGLEQKLDSLPAGLSGGEAQRVAIARALAQRPGVLLCDEPTGHLDTDTATRILELIEALRARYRFALVVATHDVDVAARMGRAVELADGRVVGEQK